MSAFFEALKVTFEILIWVTFFILLAIYYILSEKIKAEDEEIENKRRCEKELEELNYFFKDNFSEELSEEEKEYFRNDWM